MNTSDKAAKVQTNHEHEKQPTKMIKINGNTKIAHKNHNQPDRKKATLALPLLLLLIYDNSRAGFTPSGAPVQKKIVWAPNI